MLKRISSTALALTFFLAGSANAADGEKRFKEGTRSFQQGEYSLALEQFRSALAVGYETPSLYYNLGVSHYRLGQYGDAREAFLKAADHPPLAALAHYNLGLTARKQGHDDEAARWFRRAAETENPKLRRLARQQLEDGTNGGGSLAVVSVNLGYDDNVVDPEELTADEGGDGFAEVFAGGDMPLGSGRTRVEGALYRLDYFDVDSFNLTSVRAAVEHRFSPVPPWTGTLDTSRSYLGGEGYQRTVGLALEGYPAPVKLRYRLLAVDGDAGFDYLDGTRHQVDAAFKRNLGDASFRAAYRFEQDRREDLAVSGTFTSYSPTRHTVRLAVAYPWGPWEALLEGRFRTSRYADPNVLEDGTTVTREDDRPELRFRISRPFANAWEAAAEYLWVDNRSNLDSYDYTRNQVTFGISRLFH